MTQFPLTTLGQCFILRIYGACEL